MSNPNPPTHELSPPPSPHNLRIYTLVLLSSLGSWMFGYNNAYIAGILILPSFHHDFKLPPLGTAAYDTTVANIVSLFQIGGLVGSVAMFGGMKYWGRKGCLAGAGGVFTVGAVMMTLSNGGLGLIYAGRFITGFGTGSISVVVPLYIAELSPPSIRGSLVGIYEINNQLSSLLGYWVNYIVNEYISPTSSTQWRLVLALQIIPSVLLLLSALFILPETPRFLVSRGRFSEARKVLAYVRKLSEEHEAVDLEMVEIGEAARGQSQSAGVDGGDDGRGTGGLKGAVRRFTGLCRELGWKGNRNRVLIGVGLMAGQNLTGINGVNFYTPYVFRSIGFAGTRVQLLASGMFALVKSLSTILSLVFLIDRLGRRKLLLASSIGTALSLWYIGAFVEVANIDMNSPRGKSIGGWVAIVCVYIYAASFSIAWSGVVWVYCAEIFPTRIKDLAICITTTVQWLGQFAVARATPPMVSNMRGGFFLFFATCITTMLVLVYFLVPETKGRTLEAMDEVFGNAYAARDIDDGGVALGSVVVINEGKVKGMEEGKDVEGGIVSMDGK